MLKAAAKAAAKVAGNTVKCSRISQTVLAIALSFGILLAPGIAFVPPGAVLPAKFPLQTNKPIMAITKTTVGRAANTQYPQIWIPVPSWLAGTWHASSEIILSSYNYSTKNYASGVPKDIRINRTSKIGAQRDRLGVVWHLASPNLRMIDAGEFIEYQNIESVNVVSSSASSVVVKTKAAVSRISKDGKDLLETFKEETVTTYTPLSDAELITDFVITDYDTDGNPTFSSRAICTERRIGQFTPVDQDERGQLKVMFHEFLLDRGHLNLIPINR